MGMNIYPIPLGFDHCYIIQDKGTIMVDGGAPKKAKEFTKVVENLSIKPEEVQLIVLTHGHWDHIASAKEIKEITGAKIAINNYIVRVRFTNRSTIRYFKGANINSTILYSWTAGNIYFCARAIGSKIELSGVNTWR